MQLEQRQHAMPQLHLNDQQVAGLLWRLALIVQGDHGQDVGICCIIWFVRNKQ